MKTNVAKNYLLKADHDLGTAELIFKNQPKYTDTITFHSQQTIEKVLKAFLTFHNQKVKTSHDIVSLLKDCTKLEAGFANFSTPSITDLNEMGMSVRYEDILKDPKEEEAFRYLELAREIKDFVLEKLLESGFDL